MRMFKLWVGRWLGNANFSASKQEQGERLPKTQKVTTFAPAVLAAGQ